MARAKKQTHGLTIKQEKFCHAYIETGNASEAYRQTYNCLKSKPETINRQAKALIDNHKISTRLNELRAPAIEKAKLTVESHLEELQRLKELAVKSKQYSSAIKAEELRGKVAQFYTENLNVNQKLKVLIIDD